MRKVFVRLCMAPNRWRKVGNFCFRFSEPLAAAACMVPTVLARRFPEGFVMELDASQKTSRQLLLLPQYEMWVAAFLRTYVKKRDVCVDVGAHQGYFSLLISSLVGQGRVFAAEAAEDNYLKLKRNIALSSAHHIEAFHIALSDRKGEVSLYRNPHNEGGHSLVAREGPTERVLAATLDEFLKERNLTKPPAIIKIDAEGHELSILRGAHDTLRGGSSLALVVELSRDRENIVALMKEAGFRGYFFGRRGLEPLPAKPHKGNALFTRGYDTISLTV